MPGLSVDGVANGENVEVTVNPHRSRAHYGAKEGDFTFDGVEKRNLVGVIVGLSGGHVGTTVKAEVLAGRVATRSSRSFDSPPTSQLLPACRCLRLK